MKKSILLFSGLLLAGCAGEHAEVRVDLAEIGGAAPVLSHHSSACELSQDAGQAGWYRVESLTGVYEEFPVGSSEWQPATYIELELLEPWTTNATSVTLRVAGGPLPDDTFVKQFVELSRGEVVAAIVLSEFADNADYPFITNEHLFRRDGEALTNGAIHAAESDLSAVIGLAIEQGACPTDVGPN